MTHGRSISHTNSLINGDNKGVVTCFIEDIYLHKNNNKKVIVQKSIGIIT